MGRQGVTGISCQLSAIGCRVSTPAEPMPPGAQIRALDADYGSGLSENDCNL
jgi:hypothetical protein